MIRTILVDDEQIVLRGLRETIDWEHYGIEVVGEATGGKQALQILRTQPVDLLLIDIIMPGMSGLELLEQIQEEAPDVVVVMISCHASFDYIQQALRQGAVDYLVKTELEEEQLDQNLKRISRRVQRILSTRDHRKAHIALVKQREAEISRLLWENIWFIDIEECRELMQECEKLEILSLNFRKRLVEVMRKIERAYHLPVNCLQLEKAMNLENTENLIRWLEQGAERATTHFFAPGYREEIVVSVLRAVNYLLRFPGNVANQSILCEKFSISRSYFSKVFPALLGTSFQEYIQQVRIETAKQLIDSREVPLEDIAASVGLEDTKYFNKMFQKTTGMTLAAWQHRIEKGETTE